ncbi:MAG: cbb3-type cytochrome c oxidase subunit I [Acidimicrobiia bacterium]|nr:cbb3-type cytochrome c oxidase subunit I [Acidimicrobiia bacterium]
MALTESRTPTDARTAGAPETATLDGLLGSADHKTLGRFWIAGGLTFLLGALVVSAVAGIETIDLGSFTVASDADQFTQIWSLGREVLLFGGLLPILVGLATYLVPLQIGAPAIAFARGAAGAFWAWLIGTVLLVVSYIFNGGPGGGKADFVVLWTVSLGLVILALLWAMVILATTILGARTIGMTLDRTPFASWSFLVFCLYGILTLPLVVADLALTYVRVRHGFVPLDARQTLVGVTNLFTYAPTLFWLAIPALGMAADTIGVHTARPVMLRKPIMAAVGALSVISFGAVYFSFGSVRTVDFNNFMLVLDIAATALPILAVLGLAGESIRRGTPRLNVAFIGSLLGGLLFLLAAVTALLGLFEPVQLWLIDNADTGNPDKLLILNGTTFHDGLRGIVVGATVLSITGALHHWAPKIWGRTMAEPLGFAAVLAAAGGGVLWGLGGVLAGVDNQPAYPVSSLAGGDNVELYNLIALIGIVAVAAGALLTALSAAQSAVGRTSAAGAPGWSGLTLEWATSSPPSPGNFDQPPVVRSATPLADAVPESGSAETTTGTDAGGEA